jgi:mannose-6-phosphate isomerase class I
MEPNGDVRPLQIKEYFNAIDQSPEHNDPTGHMRKASQLVKTDHYTLSSLLRNRHYNLDQLKFANSSSTYGETITRYKHIFVKSGGVKVSAGSQLLMVTAAHSFFIPAATGKYSLESTDPNTELLISY